MKLIRIKINFLLLIELALLFSEFTSKIKDNQKDKRHRENGIIPDIDLRNFDIREKFYDCYNPGYDADIIERTACYQNWFVQFTLLLTDKICIFKNRTTKRILSPMNLISCINLQDGLKLTCSNSAQFYDNNTITLDTVKKTIDFFNLNGTQYKDENDYSIIKETKSFKQCENYNSSIDYKIDPNIDELDEINDDDFKMIKYQLFLEGPLLAVLQTNIDIYTSTEPIYSPQPKTQLDGMKFLRVIGWQTIDEKHYWIFTFTKGNDWEIMNYKLIASKDFGLKFINIKLK